MSPSATPALASHDVRTTARDEAAMACNDSPVRVQRRAVPYPYRAALAICSDLDETADLEVYVETLRFLNGERATRFGDGVDLEVGNTIYFDMPPGHFSYWNTTDRGRAMIRELIRSGHIDCLHSFGDLAATRAHAARALDELSRHDCRLQVWIDHAVAPSNFGADIMRGQGDVAGSPVFHADLTCSFGIEYVWRGRVTSVAGQGVARQLRGIATRKHPVVSTLTVLKEACKGAVGSAVSGKYEMHATNAVLRAVALRSGHRVYEFLRCNPHSRGVSCGETASGIAEVLVDSTLQRLVDRGGFCVLYTHLGKGADPRHPISSASAAAFRRLASYSSGDRILVTTTRRLLGYCRAVEEIDWSASMRGDWLRIDVSTGSPAVPRSDLEGLTFYVPDPDRAIVLVDGIPQTIQSNPRDQTGRFSVSLPRRRLTFPKGLMR
jgi:hypothetical protein